MSMKADKKQFPPGGVDVPRELAEKLLPEFRCLADGKGIVFHIHNRSDNSIVSADRNTVENTLRKIIEHTVSRINSGNITIVSYNNDNGRLCIDIRAAGDEYCRDINDIEHLTETINGQLIVQHTADNGNILTLVFGD